MSTNIDYSENKVPGQAGSLLVRSWTPARPARAVVAIVPGFNSHSGYYLSAGAALAESGYATFALDLRGRGQSDGERYFVRAVEEYTSDVDVMVRLARSRAPGLPFFLLGHSAGGVISCVYALEHQSELSGLICESFAFQVYAPDFALSLLKGLSHIAPHARVLKLPSKDFSRDASKVAVMDSDPYVAHEVEPASTVAAMVRANEKLKVSFPDMTLPVLILHGTSDKVTRPGGSQFFADTVGSSDKTLRLYEGHFHDLLNDTGKEGVLEDIVNWIDARTERPAHDARSSQFARSGQNPVSQ